MTRPSSPSNATGPSQILTDGGPPVCITSQIPAIHPVGHWAGSCAHLPRVDQPFPFHSVCFSISKCTSPILGLGSSCHSVYTVISCFGDWYDQRSRNLAQRLPRLSLQQYHRQDTRPIPQGKISMVASRVHVYYRYRPFTWYALKSS